MSKEEMQLMLVRGAVASLPLENQAKIRELKRRIEEIVAEDPDHAGMAVVLVGLEKAAEE